jgi:hypothetical protein
MSCHYEDALEDGPAINSAAIAGSAEASRKCALLTERETGAESRFLEGKRVGLIVLSA